MVLEVSRHSFLAVNLDAFPNRDWREGAPAQQANQNRGVTCLLPGISGTKTSHIRKVEVVALSILGLVRQQPKCSKEWVKP